jgi:POT family proton-dependent oligopeptide transporter
MSDTPQEQKSPFKEITQPFIDLIRAPRALWGINAAYLLEGFVYFGVVQYLAMYFIDYAGLSDVSSQASKGILTAGITISMFLFGGLADKWGVRVALLVAFLVMFIGRGLLAAAPMAGGSGISSPAYLIAIGGILLVVFGYGMYQPAAYAGVRQFTSPATAGMGFAMLYALMNLGGWLPTFMSPIRNTFGISGAYWFYTGLTLLSLVLTATILTRKTVEKAIAAAKAEKPKADEPKAEETEKSVTIASKGILGWLKNHPLANAKFSFFIFCLIPVQTLFAYNFGTIQAYVSRAYKGTWLGTNFEVATNFNALLIFILVPIVTALTQKRKVYNMMILGTCVMAAPTFLLALGTSQVTLWGYLVFMTLGEAMWQPRFLQYAAEIAPEGRTGAYMGVAQLPWFLTKMLVPWYEGWFLQEYCPLEGEMHPETMWLIYGCIAICSTILLILAKGWVGRDFKTKAD